jgi:glucan phosphoethanolaminetransferase (alkaline phosphatase superfamily)
VGLPLFVSSLPILWTFILVMLIIINRQQFLSTQLKKYSGFFIFFHIFIILAVISFTKIWPLPNNYLSLLMALLFLLPPLLLGLLDLEAVFNDQNWKCQKTSDPKPKDFHLFISLILTSIIVVVLNGVHSGRALIENILCQSLISMLIFAILTYISRLSERAEDELRYEFKSIGILAIILSYWFFSTTVFPAIAFTGWPEKIFVAFFALSLITAIAGTAIQDTTTPAKFSSGLTTMISPLGLGFKSRYVLFIFLFVIIFATPIALTRTAFFDWNFLGQKLISVMSWILIFALIGLIIPMQAPKRISFQLYYPYVFAFLVLISLRFFSAQIKKTEPGNNISFKMAQNIFFSSSFANDDTFYRFLLSQSNIAKEVVIAPVNINLTTDTSKSISSKPNIIVIVIDSLRRDYVAPYNPDVTFTPKMANFAKDSIVLENTFTRYGATGLSEPSIWVGGMMLHKQYITPFYSMNSLQKLLEIEDYHLMASIDEILRVIVKPSPSIEELDHGSSTQDLDLCKTLPELEKKLLLSAANNHPVFAYTQSQNIHISVLNRHGIPVNKGQYPGFYDPYVIGLSRIDQCFGKFMEDLKSKQILQNTIVLLTADHGDSLGEDGRFGHAYNIFPEIIRIPLIIYLPDSIKNSFEWNPQRITFTTDITPSLYTLLGHPPTNANPIFGRSIFWPKGSAPIQREAGPYLLASSYGAVYGLLSESGKTLYIADAINFIDYNYDLNSKTHSSNTVTLDMKQTNENIIHKRITEIGQYYGFKAP